MSLDLLAAFLKTVGAFQTAHSGRTLGHHLLGTYALLKDAGCDEETCLAGGLHSIYGTHCFKNAICDPIRHGARIETLFGERVEDLVFRFKCAPTRDIEAVNRRDPDDGQFYTLALIAAANILEQGGSLDRWPRISEAWENQVRSHGVSSVHSE